jgi:hypothetical protein
MMGIIVFLYIRLSLEIIFIYLPEEFVYLELMLRDVVEWIKYQFDSIEELNPDRGKEIRGEEILINLGSSIDEDLRKNNNLILGIIFGLGVKWACSQDTQIQVLGICVVAASAIIYCGPKIYQYILDSLSSAEDPDQREGEDYPSDQSEKHRPDLDNIENREKNPYNPLEYPPREDSSAHGSGAQKYAAMGMAGGVFLLTQQNHKDSAVKPHNKAANKKYPRI